MNFRFLIFLCLLQGQAIKGFGQEQDSLRQGKAEPVFSEPTGEGTTRFFFDESYSLVDRDCEYVAIERIGTYSEAVKGFTGAFADYDLDGRLLLEGSYAAGKKQGAFTAYFPNGAMQWQVTFENDTARGIWRFNYPDEKPLMEILYDDKGTKLQSFWDELGRQRVVNGNGRYVFAVKALGYNEYGYEFVEYSGDVRHGVPKGTWVMSHLFEDGARGDAGYEYFDSRQRFKSGYDISDDERYKASRIRLGPAVYFDRAEKMVAKDCSIDEHEDFPLFIAHKLENAFRLFNVFEYGSRKVKVNVEINKRGAPMVVEVLEGYEDTPKLQQMIERILIEIAYWIPSYKDEEFIDDNLELNFQIVPNAEPEAGIVVNGIKIRRENGY